MSRLNGSAGVSPGNNDRPDPPSTSPPDPAAEFAWLQPYVSPSTFDFITQNIGLTFVAAAQFFFACMNITVKYFLSITNISVSTLILVRMGITSLGCVIALGLIYRDPSAILGPHEARKLLFARGLAGMVGLYSSYKSYQGLSVSDAMSIGFLVPTLTAILGWVILRERCSVQEIVAGLACLVGVVLVSRPPFIFGHWDDNENGPVPPNGQGQSTTRMEGVAWSLLGVCGAASAYLIIRKIGHAAHALHSMGYFAYMCTAVTAIITLFSPRDTVRVETRYQFFLIILIGIFGFAGQMLLTMGLQRERVGRAGIAIYLSVFFAIILELVFLHTFPAFLSLVGIAIILSSAYWVALSKKPTNSKDTSQSDPEARPFSPAPSPASSPVLRTVRRSNSYMSISKADPGSPDETSESYGLLKAHPYPGAPRSRSGSSTQG